MGRLIRASAALVAAALVLALAASTQARAVATAQREDNPEPEFKSGDYSYFTEASGAAVILRYRGTDTELTLPGSPDGHPVKGIGDGAFYAGGFTSIVFPEGLLSIGEEAFARCDSLLSVTLPEGLLTIGGTPRLPSPRC